MKTKFLKLPLLVAVLVLGAGALGWRPALARKPGPAAAPATETAEGSDELAALRRQLHALQDEQSRTRFKVDSALKAGAAAKEQAPGGEKAEAEPATPEELRRRDYERSKHVVEYVQKLMDDESPDVAWAPARVEEIKASFKDFKLPGFALRDAECRATLCRTTIERGPDAITQELGTAVMQLEPLKKMGAFFHYEDDRVVMYSPREGHDFPKDPALATR
jgi:hypothetical protein